MCYFDEAYFDPTYFDVCVTPSTSVGHPGRRPQRILPAPEPLRVGISLRVAFGFSVSGVISVNDDDLAAVL